MSKAVQQMFDEIAPRYDFLNHFLSLSIDKRWRDRALKALGKDFHGPILDLCAGTLDLTQRLMELFPHCPVTSVDFSLGMLEMGRKKLAKGSDEKLVCGDGHHLPFQDESFAAIVCAFGIRNLEHREVALREIHRVLRPGGKLIVLEFFRPETGLAKIFYQTYGRFLIPLLGGALARNRQAYQYLQDSIQKFHSASEYEGLLHKMGFQHAKWQALSGGIAQLLVTER